MAKNYALGMANYHIVENGALCLKPNPEGDVSRLHRCEVVGPNVAVQDIPEEYGEVTLREVVQRSFRALLNPRDRFAGVVDRFPFAIRRIWAPASSKISVCVRGESNAYLYVTKTFEGASLCFDDMSSLQPSSSQLIRLHEASVLYAVGLEGYIVDEFESTGGSTSGEGFGPARPIIPRTHLCNGMVVSTYDTDDLRLIVHHARAMNMRANMTIPVIPSSEMTAVVPLSGSLLVNMRSLRSPPTVKFRGAALVPPGASPAFTPAASNFMMIRMRG